MWTQLPPQRGAQQPLLFGPCLLWRNSRTSQQLLSSCLFYRLSFLPLPSSISIQLASVMWWVLLCHYHSVPCYAAQICRQLLNFDIPWCSWWHRTQNSLSTDLYIKYSKFMTCQSHSSRRQVYWLPPKVSATRWQLVRCFLNNMQQSIARCVFVNLPPPPL